MHLWLFGLLDSLETRRGSRENVVAPRGSAKSTIASLAYPLRCAVTGSEPYIVITSDTGQQASKFLDTIRAELETNERLRADYPLVFGSGRTWRQDRIILRNGVQIESLGTGTKLRGRRHRQHRPTLVVVDDPQNKDHILSALQRERSWEWLTKDVLNAGSPSTNYLVLGTALHRDSIVCKLQRTPGWSSSVWRSVESWPDRLDLWKEWESIYSDYEDPDHEQKARAFYASQRDEMNQGHRVLWSQRESLYDLMALQATIGRSAFASEKQNEPINPDACEWPADYFDVPGFWFEQWPSSGLVVKTIGLDPSKGKDAGKGDLSAFVLYGVDRNGIEYVECDMRRRTADAIVADGVEHVRTFRPEGLAIETNTFQELFLPLFRAAGQQAGLTLPIYGIENTVNKEVRIRRHTPYLAQRRARFKARSPGTALLVQQLKDFPVGDHDDGPDAWEAARRLALHLLGGKVAGRKPQAAR